MTKPKHSADFLVSMALVAAFILLALFTAALGAGIYRDTVSVADSNSNVRTALMYVTQRVRRADAAGGAFIADLGVDGDALVIRETELGGNYYTYIYVKDGYLRELTSAGEPGNLALGQEIFSASRLELSETGGVVTASLGFADGSAAQAVISAKGAFDE